MAKVIVKFKTQLNVSWGKKINGFGGFAYPKGFPALFFMTTRRVIVVAEFLEKMGWGQKKRYHRICYEAGLDQVKDFAVSFGVKKRQRRAHITFKAHGDLDEGSTIQFILMDPRIGQVIKDHLSNLNIKKPLMDSGIVQIDRGCPELHEFIQKRIGFKGIDALPSIE